MPAPKWKGWTGRGGGLWKSAYVTHVWKALERTSVLVGVTALSMKYFISSMGSIMQKVLTLVLTVEDRMSFLSECISCKKVAGSRKPV